MWYDVHGLPRHLCRANPLYDIQEIEGIGPLIALTTWTAILRESLWLHFIDNTGALTCLIKGGVEGIGN